MSENEHRRTGLSRREVLRTGAAAGAAAAFGGMAAVPASAAPAQGRPAGGRDDADLALVNGKIHTMDAENVVVSTVLIRDGRVLPSATGPGSTAAGTSRSTSTAGPSCPGSSTTTTTSC